MATNYLQEGGTVQFTAPTGGYTKDQLVGLPAQDANQKFVGVVVDTVAAGSTAVLLTEGVYSVTKTAGAGEAWAIGDDLYLTATGACTESATTNGYVGVAWEAAVTGATTGKVRINFGGDPR